MAEPLLAPLFALCAATCWGAGDFTGGVATRRLDAYRSVLYSYAVGLVALVIVALARGEPIPSSADIAWGVASGLAGMVGIVFLFRGFAAGRMGIVAPVSAVLATTIPVVFSALTRGLPGSLQLAGFVIGLAAIWLISRPERLSGRPEGLGSAVIAGIGFAGFFIGLDQISRGAVFWPLAAGRIASCTVMVIFAAATRRPLSIRRAPVGLLLLVGVLDVAGNLFFLLATQSGRLDSTVVLGSLYPAVTALLAWLILKEHMARQQIAGVGAAILAIVLITLPAAPIG